MNERYFHHLSLGACNRHSQPFQPLRNKWLWRSFHWTNLTQESLFAFKLQTHKKHKPVRSIFSWKTFDWKYFIRNRKQKMPTHQHLKNGLLFEEAKICTKFVIIDQNLCQWSCTVLNSKWHYYLTLSICVKLELLFLLQRWINPTQFWIPNNIDYYYG